MKICRRDSIKMVQFNLEMIKRRSPLLSPLAFRTREKLVGLTTTRRTRRRELNLSHRGSEVSQSRRTMLPKLHQRFKLTRPAMTLLKLSFQP